MDGAMPHLGSKSEMQSRHDDLERREMTQIQPVRLLPAAAEDVKLAAVAVGLNVRLRSSYMPLAMQEHAFRCTRAVLDDFCGTDARPNHTRVAMFLKKEFDGLYGLAWHCVVGKSFGSFVTHSSGGFVYFSIENLSLLFKTEVH